MFKAYYSLTKPGIIRGNLISLTAGFLLASKTDINIVLFIALIIGTSLIIASGSVFNNVIDRKIDLKMDRTKKRATATGKVSPASAYIFASLLGIVGVIVLDVWVNLITVAVGLFGLFAYVVLYGFAKRKSIHGTLVGSISGATPPVAGYVAVTGNFDLASAILFLILVFWQMPHFYAIAIFRSNDYKNAGLPVMPVKKSVMNTKIQVLAYIVVFTFVAPLLSISGYAGKTYLIIACILGLGWFYYGASYLKSLASDAWARKMFGLSLIVLLVICFTISVDSMLP